VTIRGLIGVVHLRPLPGDPRGAGATFDAVADAALRDLEALSEADAIIVENFGSAPFYKGTATERVPPHQVAALARVVRRCVESAGKPVGVNVLRNDAPAALGIAAACGASFVRVNVHTGAYVTDQGLIEGEAAASLRYRATLGAPVLLLADVLVKHAAPLAPIAMHDAVRDVIERGCADGVIVTGSATGAPIDLALLRQARAAAGDAPLYAGSGLTPENAAELAPHCDGAIVGTWLKRDGDVRAPVDAARVGRLAALLRPLWRART
jgi:uncharacterized protein